MDLRLARELYLAELGLFEPCELNFSALLRRRTPAGLALLRAFLAECPPLAPECIYEEPPLDGDLVGYFRERWAALQAAFDPPEYRVATVQGLLAALEKSARRDVSRLSFQLKNQLRETVAVGYRTVSPNFDYDCLHPFERVVREGWAEHVQIASEWCRPSPAMIHRALKSLLSKLGRGLLSNSAEATNSVLAWLFGRTTELSDPEFESMGSALVYHTDGRQLRARAEFLAGLVAGCPALTPGVAKRSLAHWSPAPAGRPPLDAAFRRVLEEAAGRELRFAWVAATVLARRAP